MGVVPSPSRWCDERPFRPTRAFHGPATLRQQPRVFLQSETDAYVVCACAATTSTSWFELPAATGGAQLASAAVTAKAAITRPEYAARFPIRRMEPVEAFRGSDDRSMAADNTSAFNCRYAVAPGAKHWSVHAYGEAIDVNTVENSYVEGGLVRPAAGRRFLDRENVRPGMAVPNGVLVKSFLSVGWKWGGRWTSSPDYQHFSATGG